MWQFPWKYRESFAIAIGLLCVGVLLQFVAPLKVQPPASPYNFVVGLNFIAIPLLLFAFARRHPLVVWLGSIPAAISAVSLFTVLSLIMGFVPQTKSTLLVSDVGFGHLLSSWQYVFAEAYFMFTLGMVIVRRAVPFRVQNIGFLLNHLGLWLVIVGIALGMGDKEKVGMRLIEKQTEWRGVTEQGQLVEMPLAITLRSFSIDDYNPSIGLVDNATQELIIEQKHEQQFLIDSGAQVTKQGWTLKVAQYLPDASLFEERFVRFASKGSVPAAYIKARNAKGEQSEGWISCGNYLSPAVSLRLDRNVSLVMLPPRPKCYRSKLHIDTKYGESMDTVIEVNRPVQIRGWKLYQTGFDDKKGKWSDVSIIEAVRDPWLPVIYLGMAMLIAGAAVMFWKGRKGN